MFQRCFQPIVPDIIVLPASLCLTTSKQLVWNGAVIFWWYEDPEKLTYASRGQESQKKDKTIKSQHANCSIKCLASSFALKQAPLIQASLLTGKQNFSSCLSYSGQIFKNSINNCISCSTVPLEMCGACQRPLTPVLLSIIWNLLLFFIWVYETTIIRFNS